MTGYRSADMAGLLGRRPEGAEARNAPGTIYYEGSLDVPLPSPRVSVIGTRKPSEEGLGDAERIAGFLADNGVTVVSGLARGVDTAAHRAAIARGGRTVAVIGTPLDVAYPRENEGLQGEMMRDQLVVSQFAAGEPVTARSFVRRNLTMALVSDAAVVIEADDKSGTLYHARETLRLARPLFFCPRAAYSGLEWPAKLEARGAVRIDDPARILECLPGAGIN